MLDHTEKTPAEGVSPTPNGTPSPADPPLASAAPAAPDVPAGNQAAGAEGPEDDPAVALKRRPEKHRLPADVREQILTELPSPEDQERLYRELQEHGGLSAEEFLQSLGLDVEPRP